MGSVRRDAASAQACGGGECHLGDVACAGALAPGAVGDVESHPVISGNRAPGFVSGVVRIVGLPEKREPTMNRQNALPAPRRRISTHPEHCPMSGKARYRDAREATDALRLLVNKAALADERGGKHSIRVKRKYPCTACRGWHLTSQEAWTGQADRQTDPLTTAASAEPAPRRLDPLLAALARSTGLKGRPGMGLAA